MTSRPTVRQAAHLFTALSLCLLATACSQVPVMRGEIVGLRDVIEQADRNGAKRCAPRELALAMAHEDEAGMGIIGRRCKDWGASSSSQGQFRRPEGRTHPSRSYSSHDKAQEHQHALR